MKNKKKTILIVVASILIISGLFFIFFFKGKDKTKQAEDTINIPLTPTPSSGTSVPSTGGKKIQQYYLRSLGFRGEAKSLYWKTSYPILITTNSLINLVDNSTVYSFEEGSTLLDIEGSSVLATFKEDDLYLFDPIKEVLKRTKYRTDAIYSPNFRYYAVLSNQKIDIYNLEGDFLSSFQNSISGNSLLWSFSEDFVVVQSNKNVLFLNLVTKETKKITIENTPKELLLSQNGKYLSVSFEDFVEIFEIPTFEKVNIINLDSDTRSFALSWTQNNNLVILEKEFRPREVDLFYIQKPLEKTKTFIYDSYPIPSRVDLSISVVSSKNDDFIFSDKSGGLWVLSTETLNPIDKSIINKSHED